MQLTLGTYMIVLPLVFLAALVVFILLAVYLPIFGMYGSI